MTRRGKHANTYDEVFGATVAAAPPVADTRLCCCSSVTSGGTAPDVAASVAPDADPRTAWGPLEISAYSTLTSWRGEMRGMCGTTWNVIRQTADCLKSNIRHQKRTPQGRAPWLHHVGHLT